MATENGTTAAAESGYADVNGLRMYYEIRGTGRPLILLHGGVVASEVFAPILPALSATRRVVTVHLQAHGRTADIDRPLSFEAMADDIAALAARLDLGPTDLLGYSLGGGVALQTAIRHPDAVGRLVVISAPFSRAGWYPEVVENMTRMGEPGAAEAMRQSPMAALYPAVDWAALFAKIARLEGQDYDWSADVASIRSPTMIVYADADAVRPAHVVEFFGLLGGGKRDAGLDGSGRPANRMAVLPGMTHYTVLTFPGLAAIVTAFLDATARDASNPPR